MAILQGYPPINQNKPYPNYKGHPSLLTKHTFSTATESFRPKNQHGRKKRNRNFEESSGIAGFIVPFRFLNEKPTAKQRNRTRHGVIKPATERARKVFPQAPFLFLIKWACSLLLHQWSWKSCCYHHTKLKFFALQRDRCEEGICSSLVIRASY